MLERLVRLYPAGWRARYGEELEQLVRDLRPGASAAALAADLVKGAFAVRLREVAVMKRVDWRAIGRGLLVAGIVQAGLSALIVLSNVVFPTKHDDDLVGVLAGYLSVFAALYVAGWLAARGGAGARGQVLAGLVAGVAIGLATAATFFVVDNVWLDIVSRQQNKIDGFAHSGASSMREYVNDSIKGTWVFFPVLFGVSGILLSLAGGRAQRVWRSA